jgi:hypothetical protein
MARELKKNAGTLEKAEAAATAKPAASAKARAAGPAKATAPAAKAAAAPAATKKAASHKAPAKAAAGSAGKSGQKAPAVTPEQRYCMIQDAAYFIAERHGFVGDNHGYWLQAEHAIDAELATR